MDDWQKLQETLKKAKTTARGYRQESGRIRATSARLGPNEVSRATMRGDSAPLLEREQLAARGQLHLLSPEAAEARIGELRREAQTEIAGHIAEAREWADLMRHVATRKLEQAQPTGAEAIAARVEAADARGRVRSLLDGGMVPGDIVTRAAQLGDRTMLEALRDEVRWTIPDQGGLDRAMARRLGFDEDEPDPSALLRRIDEAELDLLPEGLRAAKSDLIRLDHEWPLIDRELELTANTLDGGPSLDDAVALRYARSVAGVSGPAGDGDGGDGA